MSSSRGLPNSGIKPASLTSPALAGRLFTTSTTWEALRKQQSCLQKQGPAQDTLGCRNRHTPRYASSAHNSKATCEWALYPCSMGDQPDLLSWADLENIAVGGSSGEITWILTKQAQVQGCLALNHRPGLPEPPS